jgi:hypothetical protein
MPQAFFVLVILEIGFYVFALDDRDYDPLIYTSQVAGMIGAHHHVQFID